MLEWLNNFWLSLVQFVQDLFYWIGNTLIKAVAALLSWLLGIFPDYVIPTPGTVTDYGGQFFSTLSWVFPVRYSIALVAVFVAAYGLLFTGGFILRFFGVIR